ncbi:hypothetical protein [Paenibacillus sp. DYY-L-2]|uniref:hypothetical protein n=1 Tax=Paenibacillus sp. DYY-L-2 TaxID=3447013 RepID=UPI003F4FBB38
MKRRLVGFILSFALLGGTIGCSTDSNRPGQGSGNDSLGQWIRQIPQAEAGEFPTPEAVIHAFIEAVNDNDYDNALKCFPIAQYVEAYTLEVHYKSRLSYSPEDPSDPLPLNDAQNFLLLFTGYHAIWNQFFNTLLMDSHPELEGFEIVKDDPEAQNKLDQLETQLSHLEN